MENWMPVIGLIGFAFALFLYFRVAREKVTSDKMNEIADAIHVGAMTFLKREYTSVAI